MAETFADLFSVPEEYYKKQKPAYFQTIPIDTITYDVRVCEEHPLWAHYVWNASKCIALHFQSNPDLVKNKRVLELGAGAALPSLAAIKMGAQFALITDYPDTDLLDNISHNVQKNLTNSEQARTTVLGYAWGKPLAYEPFDIIILSDLICNHAQHPDLLRTCLQNMHANTQIFVAHSHHRPWLTDKDNNFFTMAATPEYGFQVVKLYEKKYPVMFEKDPGDEEVRKTVHVHLLSKPY